MSKKLKLILSLSIFLIIVLIISHFTLGSPFSFPFLDWFFNQEFEGTEMTREDAYGLSLTGMEIVARVGDKFEGENREKGWMDGQIVDIRPLGFYTGKFARQHFAVIELPNINYWDLRGSKDWKSTATSTKEFKKYLSIADTERKRDYFIDFRWLLDKGYITKDQYFDIYDRDKTHDQISLDFTNIEQLFSHEDKKERLARLYKKENKVLTFFKRMIPSAYAITNGTYSIGSGLDYDTVTLFEAAIEAQLTGNLTGEHNNEETSISTDVTFDTDTNSYLLKLTAQSGDEHNGGVYGNGARITMATNDSIAFNETIDGDLDDAEVSNLAIDACGVGNYGIAPNDGFNDGSLTLNRLLIKGDADSYYGIRTDADSCLGTTIRNCIIYGFSKTGYAGIYLQRYTHNSGGNFSAYNNTVIGCYYNIRCSVPADATLSVKNNLCQNAGYQDYKLTQADTTGHNISEDDTSPDEAYQNKEVAFVDEANDDYHLAGNDVAARNEGEDLSGTFTEDIDGETRGYRGWDIGADETFASTMINTTLKNKLTDGLVGHWTFNGQDMDWASTTAEALDRSGNSNNGNVTNFDQTSVARGISGQALEFDGVDDYINAGSDSSLDNVFSDGGTIMAWIYQTAWTDTINYIYNKDDGAGDYIDFMWTHNTNHNLYFKQDFSIQDDEWYTDTDTISLNTWYYVAITYNNSSPDNNPIIYMDGVAKSITENPSLTGSGTAESNANGNFEIGGRAAGDRTFPGIIDELRVYNRMLSADEVEELYRAGARRLTLDAPMVQKDTGGLVGHWTFNGQDMDWASTTAEALDRSGNSNNGNVTNFDHTSVARGISGQALEFDGVDDYVDISNEENFDFTNDFSICSWVYWRSNGGNISIISKRSAYKIDATAGNYLRFTTLDVKDYITTFIPSFNQWYYICVVLDSSNDANFYIDGVFYQKVTHTSPANVSNYNLLIAANAEEATYFNGLIDEVRIYDRALSANEVLDLYQAGAGRMKLK